VTRTARAVIAGLDGADAGRSPHRARWRALPHRCVDARRPHRVARASRPGAAASAEVAGGARAVGRALPAVPAVACLRPGLSTRRCRARPPTYSTRSPAEWAGRRWGLAPLRLSTRLIACLRGASPARRRSSSVSRQPPHGDLPPGRR
jgi:hypothetical protein